MIKYEPIRDEVVRRAKTVSKNIHDTSKASGLLDELETKVKVVVRSEEFADETVSIINEVLDERGITLEELNEKEEFLNYIKPTIISLINDHMTGDFT